MVEKHNHPFSVKLTEKQESALKIEAEMRGISEADLVRGFIDEISRKQVHAYRLLAEHYKITVNNENQENVVYPVCGVKQK